MMEVLSMCELLGMSFNVPVRPSISFRGFRQRGRRNYHGWGIAFYPDRAVQIMKEEGPAQDSKLSKFLSSYPKLRSEIFIGHVRLTSGTEVSYRNSHPFSRELGGKEYVFAHNGTIHNLEDFGTGQFRPVGDTDSEHVFCHIMNWIEERDIVHWDDSRLKELSQKLIEINDEGTFNCILSDGEYLFCYYDRNGYNGLCFVQRTPPYTKKIKLEDEDWEIDLAFKKSSDQEGFVIATKRLTNEQWNDFKFGELIVFRRGELVFSSTGRKRGVVDTEVPLSQLELQVLHLLRQKTHRTKLSTLRTKLNVSMEILKPAMRTLICRGFVVQDSRAPSRVKWDNDEATYYTNRNRRDEIDSLVGEHNP